MTFSVHQAIICYNATKALVQKSPEFFKKYGVSSSWVHSVANRMDDCTSYNSHKYIDREPIEWFMQSPSGQGVVGYWNFRDGSKLVYLCNDRFVSITNQDDYTILKEMGTDRSMWMKG
jgi:hypothetical protein